MASGPSGTGWDDLAKYFNDQFSDDTKRKNLARLFVQKHGPGGKGAAGKPAYKFGRFVDQGNHLTKDSERSRFLIDAGSRRWDPSILVLEEIVRQSLTNVDTHGLPAPKVIVFTYPLTQDPAATQAKAAVTGLLLQSDGTIKKELISDPNDGNIGKAERFEVTITCPPPDLP